MLNVSFNCLPDEAEITIVIKDTDGAPAASFAPLFLSICPITPCTVSNRRWEALMTIEEKMEDVGSERTGQDDGHRSARAQSPLRSQSKGP